uniref:Uncharacterized protein n=1 Tax=Cannabis sativa TaxID=3483 RepID=A0A803QEZ1_CANSA
MIFSRLLDPQDSHEDYYYTNSQIFLHQLHNLLPLRKAKTNDEFLLVMQEIRSSWIKNAKIRDRKIKKLARALKVGINSYDDDHEGVEKNKWTMIDVMKKMYGFANREKAKNEENIIRKLKEVELSTLCLSTYCELLSPEIDEILRRKKSNLGEFLKLMNGIKNSSELDVEIEEANRELLWWLYYVEREIFLLVNDLTFVNNKCPLIGLTRKLKELKQQEQGKVPKNSLEFNIARPFNQNHSELPQADA